MKNKFFACVVAVAFALSLNTALIGSSFAACSINSCSASCPVAKRTGPCVKPCFTGKAAPVKEVKEAKTVVKKQITHKKKHYVKKHQKVVYKVIYKTKTVYKTMPCPCSNCGDNCPCKSKFPYHERKMTGGCPTSGCPCAKTQPTTTPCPCQQDTTPCPCQTK